jgi:hypothetical protein
VTLRGNSSADHVAPRILFLFPSFEDYLADSLFHGLRTTLGDRVVDYPKRDFLYNTYPPEARSRIYGRGFTLYGLLPDIPVDRDRAPYRALRLNEFDLVVIGDIWRDFGTWTEMGPQLVDTQIAILDGADHPAMYPYGPRWWRRPAWWFLPRAHRASTYFKRELTARTAVFRYFKLLPQQIAGRLPLGGDVRPIAFSIPSEKVVASLPAKTKDFAAHVVDPELADRLGATTSYAFETEAAYYADLEASRFGITTKKGGWETLRHYEIAARGAVPCFRDLDRKEPSCAPHGLDVTNSVSYGSADELLTAVREMSPERYQRLQSGALDWARSNTTVERARSFLESLGWRVGETASRPALARDSRAG